MGNLFSSNANWRVKMWKFPLHYNWRTQWVVCDGCQNDLTLNWNFFILKIAGKLLVSSSCKVVQFIIPFAHFNRWDLMAQLFSFCPKKLVQKGRERELNEKRLQICTALDIKNSKVVKCSVARKSYCCALTNTLRCSAQTTTTTLLRPDASLEFWKNI